MDFVGKPYGAIYGCVRRLQPSHNVHEEQPIMVVPRSRLLTYQPGFSLCRSHGSSGEPYYCAGFNGLDFASNTSHVYTPAARLAVERLGNQRADHDANAIFARIIIDNCNRLAIPARPRSRGGCPRPLIRSSAMYRSDSCRRLSCE